MRKSVFVRFLGFLGLYFLVFAAVASIQFTKKGNFSFRIFNLAVEGRYRVPEEGESSPGGSSPLDGEVRLSYGGMEFILSGDSTGRGPVLCLVDSGGGRWALFPEYMAVEEKGLRFYLSGGAQIFFIPQENGAELRITGDFDQEKFSGLELPFRPLKTSRVRDEENGQFIIGADGQDYRFRGSGAEGQVLVLREGALPVVYGVVDKDREWRGEDYVLKEAEAGAYREALLQWAVRNYPLWGRLILSRNDEDMIIAYEGEALQRGSFRTALSAVPRPFLSAPGRTYASSVYLGGMADAYRGLQAAEGETLTRITEALNGRGPAFFLESHVIEFLAIRGRGDLIDRGIALIRDMDPLSLTLEQIPGLLEVQTELASHWPQALGGTNPFETLTARGEFILSENLRRLPPMEHYPIGLVLAVQEGRADMEWNLRLGMALEGWGELTDRETWAAIGRSIVLSVLSLEDREGQIVSILNLDEGSPAESPASVSAARFYRLLRLGNYRPRALALNPAFPGLWAWTASPEIRVVREGQILDIAVNFPAGESHYLLIRGLEPFYRLQFYGMDWRTDPNFERYDSSGWAYYARDRTLALKVKHRAEVEHIRVYTGSVPPSVPPANSGAAGSPE
jgi:hypothetical protein